MNTIRIDLIRCGNRLRDVDEKQVAALAESIAEVGLLNPITVCKANVIRDYVATPGYMLICGLHRLRACQQLGMSEIPALVSDMGELHRQLAECDENLCGTKLTAAERSMFTSRRKDIYIALYPETRKGVAGAEAKHGRATDKLSFAADTAAKTGNDIRTVRREAERGEKISEEALSLVNGTRLDKGTYLDSLKKVPALEQLAKVKQDLAAPKRTQHPSTTAVRPELDEAEEAENAIIELLVRRLGPELSVFTQLFKLTTIWRFERKLAAAVRVRP